MTARTPGRLVPVLAFLAVSLIPGEFGRAAARPASGSPPPESYRTAPRASVQEARPDTVRVAALRRWPPYYRWSSGREPTGFAVESFREIAERAGLYPVFRRYASFPDAIRALREGEVDVLPDLGDIPSRREWAAFTEPVQTFPVVIFTRQAGPNLQDLSDLEGYTVGVVEENVGADLVPDRSAIETEVYPNVEGAMFALLAGGVDAVIYPKPVLLSLARRVGAADELRASPAALHEVRRAIAVSPTRRALLTRLDSAVQSYVGSPAYERTYRRWFGQAEPFWTVERVAWFAGGGLLLVVVILSGWRYRSVRRLNDRLRTSQRRFRQLAESIQEVFWLKDPDEDQMLYVSPAYRTIWGRPVDELYEDSDSWIESIHPDDRERMAEHFLSSTATSLEKEYRIVRGDGEIRWIRDDAFPVRDEDGEVIRVAGVARDVTERKRLEEQLRHQALHDPLTSLANRALLEDRIEQALTRARRRSAPMALLMVDIDRFKRINDSLGHTAGDRILQTVARRLRDAVRDEDTVARWGGDEFVVLATNVEDREDLEALRQRIAQTVCRPATVVGEEVPVSATMGGLLVGPSDLSGAVPVTEPEELVRYADQALHRAKEKAASSFRLFEPQEDRSVGGLKQLHRERDLRRGMEAGEFELAYQPIVELGTGRLWGVEPLARWRHPERGLIAPGEFIPLAEETGLIRDLGNTILSRALDEVAAWKRESEDGKRTDVRTTLNVSAHQFESEGLASRIEEALGDPALDPDSVYIEVTETAIMRSTGRIADLRDLGIRVLVDDFGTGYSSFLYLRDLDVDGLKIDMSFVQGLGQNLGNAAIVETILTLGEQLDLSVIAEGIETEDQLEALIDMGCRLGQGYLFARPGSLDDVNGVLPPASDPSAARSD